MNALIKVKNRLMSKTYISALLLGLITAIDVNTQFISGFFPEQYRPYLLILWPVTMMTMREITKTAVDEKNATN